MDIIDQQEREINRLQSVLDSETKRLQELRDIVAKDNKARGEIEKKMLLDKRKAKFYHDKLKVLDVEGIRDRLEKLDMQSLDTKENRLRELEKALEEFQDFEPTNEALKRKIDEMKKKRLSFDMSFQD